jgi:hypothetical protein
VCVCVCVWCVSVCVCVCVCLCVCACIRLMMLQAAVGTSVLQRAALALKRCWVLLLLCVGGVKVESLWTKARYERVLAAAGFTHIRVSALAPPGASPHAIPLPAGCLHPAPGAARRHCGCLALVPSQRFRRCGPASGALLMRWAEMQGARRDGSCLRCGKLPLPLHCTEKSLPHPPLGEHPSSSSHARFSLKVCRVAAALRQQPVGGRRRAALRAGERRQSSGCGS